MQVAFNVPFSGPNGIGGVTVSYTHLDVYKRQEQLQLANEQLQQANATVSSLTTQVNELIERIKSCLLYTSPGQPSPR